MKTAANCDNCGELQNTVSRSSVECELCHSVSDRCDARLSAGLHTTSPISLADFGISAFTSHGKLSGSEGVGKPSLSPNHLLSVLAINFILDATFVVCALSAFVCPSVIDSESECNSLPTDARFDAGVC